MEKEQVNHPDHYNSHPSGIECIDVVEHMPFNIGNAIKYLWRADHKGSKMQDLDKAIWYLNREKERLSKIGQIKSKVNLTPIAFHENGIPSNPKQESV